MKPQSITQVGVTSILNFLKYQIPTKIYEAIKILFKPCCDISIKDISFTCTNPDRATVVVTLENAVSFPGLIEYNLTSPQGGIIGHGEYKSGSKTITIKNAIITSGSDVVYTLLLYFITNSAATMGLFESAMFTVDNPTCS